MSWPGYNILDASEVARAYQLLRSLDGIKYPTPENWVTLQQVMAIFGITRLGPWPSVRSQCEERRMQSAKSIRINRMNLQPGSTIRHRGGHWRITAISKSLNLSLRRLTASGSESDVQPIRISISPLSLLADELGQSEEALTMSAACDSFRHHQQIKET